MTCCYENIKLVVFSLWQTTSPNWLLSVRVIQARNITTNDLLSSSDRYVRLWLPTASKEKVKTKSIKNTEDPVWNESFYFRVQNENILELSVCDKNLVTEDDELLTVLFDIAKVNPENLDIRLGNDLCAEEQDFLQKRKVVVASGLKKVLQLKRDLHKHEVPVIGIMATGGGLRAMSALYGHLLALQELNVLDCVTYIASSSGSTWTLTDLYQNPDWSHQSLKQPINVAKEEMLKSKLNIISIERLKYYHEELKKRVKEGHLASFTALWSLVQEAFLHAKVCTVLHKDDLTILYHGQNPLPFYAVINVKNKHISTFDLREWVEFSPYEVGFQKYGAFIRPEDFDSEFYMGRLVKKLPESRICYLEGIWTNLFSRNLLDGLYWSSNTEEFWIRWAKNMEDKASSDGYTSVFKPPSVSSGKLCEIFNDILTDRPLQGETHNFLRGLEFHKDYEQNKDFAEWKDTALDASPYKLTPMDKSLCLIDIGYFINSSFPPLVKPERNVDLIISLDYNLGNYCLKMASQYCKVQGIPFPQVKLSKEERTSAKECYVFSDEENPDAPVVIHFPLVNDTYRQYKAPGVRRSPSDIAAGEVELDKSKSPYKTIRLTYSEEDFEKLLVLSTYNILNNEDLLLQSLQNAVEKKKKCKH
uniref:Phospholipase A2 n=1 Tax=Sphenodon punctatus TaxID=8508 RepID=A0A8D0HU75_SPHPU